MNPHFAAAGPVLARELPGGTRDGRHATGSHRSRKLRRDPVAPATVSPARFRAAPALAMVQRLLRHRRRRDQRLPAESKYAHVVSGRRLPGAQVGCLWSRLSCSCACIASFWRPTTLRSRGWARVRVESKLNVSESGPDVGGICGYEIAYVAECVEAPTPSATGFTRGASQRDIWSAGDDAVSSPLVMFSARCSGSTFEHSVLRQLLNLHNVTTTKAGNNSAIHWNALSGARTQLRAFQMSAARRNATLLMLVHNSETATILSPTLHDLGASVVHMYRENGLDQVVCAIRLHDDKDYRWARRTASAMRCTPTARRCTPQNTTNLRASRDGAAPRWLQQRDNTLGASNRAAARLPWARVPAPGGLGPRVGFMRTSRPFNSTTPLPSSAASRPGAQ